MSDGSTGRDFYHVGNLDYRLMKAARELVVEVGASKVSIRMVGMRIGVSANAAYNHYKSRSELLGCVAADVLREMSAQIQQQAKNVEDQRKVLAALQAYLAYAKANPRLYQLSFGSELDETVLPIEYGSALVDLYACWRRVVAKHLGDVDLSEPVQLKAQATWSLAQGCAHLMLKQASIHLSDENSTGCAPDWIEKSLEALLASQRQ